MITRAELIEDIQSEIGEASDEARELLDHLTSVESCETEVDIKANLEYALESAKSILSDIKDQLARL